MNNENKISSGNFLRDISSPEIKPLDERDKRCAPGLKFEDGACMDLESLINMAEAYNSHFPKNQIELSSKLHTLNPKQYKRHLVKSFAERLSDVCDSQRCWMKQSFMNELQEMSKRKLTKYTFRPKGPNGQFTWLNTHNVNHVMEQYENLDNRFKFFGAVPIDFDDLPNLEIAQIDFNKLYNQGKTKIGVVFNLDEHYKSGSHWVASYIDLDKGGVYFFDSYAEPPEARIRKFMRKANTFLKNKQIDATVEHNKTRHQYGNSECGMYSLHFIIKMLEGNNFEDVNKTPISDDFVNKLREVYFT